jgi:hypothetical protein
MLSQVVNVGFAATDSILRMSPNGRNEPVVSTLNLDPEMNVAGPLLQIWPRAKLDIRALEFAQRLRTPAPLRLTSGGRVVDRPI